jgi:mono/diheme cytochrome c family protein
VTAVLASIGNSRHDLVMGIVAATLIVFSLVVALVLPRRFPDFPGRYLGLFALLAVLLVAGMLASVEALGETQHFGKAAAGESGGATTTGAATTAPTASESTSTTPTTGGGAPSGNPANGKLLFASNGCGACHTYRPAGASAQIGPDLDKLAAYARQAKKPLDDFVPTSIVDPNAYVQPGFPKNTMPTNFGDKLSDQQLADLVAFLVAR